MFDCFVKIFEDYCEKFPDMMFGDLFDAQYGEKFLNVKLSDIKKESHSRFCYFRSKSNDWDYVHVGKNCFEYWSYGGGWVTVPDHIIVKLATEGKEDFGE